MRRQFAESKCQRFFEEIEQRTFEDLSQEDHTMHEVVPHQPVRKNSLPTMFKKKNCQPEDIDYSPERIGIVDKWKKFKKSTLRRIRTVSF
jgi:hypothetical protein